MLAGLLVIIMQVNDYVNIPVSYDHVEAICSLSLWGPFYLYRCMASLDYYIIYVQCKIQPLAGPGVRCQERINLPGWLLKALGPDSY